MITARRATRYDKVSFLVPAPHIDLEFLTSKEEYTKSYAAAEGKLILVRYTKKQRTVWTEYLTEPYPRLEHISMKRVMQILTDKEKRELIENWNLLKGESPIKDIDSNGRE
jgi:hypothetical protein